MPDRDMYFIALMIMQRIVLLDR